MLLLQGYELVGLVLVEADGSTCLVDEMGMKGDDAPDGIRVQVIQKALLHLCALASVGERVDRARGEGGLPHVSTTSKQ